MNAFTLALILLVAAAQTPATSPQQPVFRARVDLLAVDVSVVDRDGRPIPGLAGSDFTVEVGGRRRPVVRAEFIDFTKAPSGPAELSEVSSNQADAGGPEPRTILLLVDDLAFGPAEGKAVFMRLAEQVDRLFPRDPLGFATLSGRGKAVEFTTDRKPIADALRTLTGSQSSLLANTTLQLGIQESIDIARGRDVRALEEAMARECNVGIRNPESAGAMDLCRQEIETAALARAEEVERESQQTVQALARVFNAMSAVPGTKYLLFVSPGIPLGRSGEIATALSRDAAAAGVRLHAFYVERNDAFDVSSPRASPSSSDDAQLRANGLEMAVGAAGGAMHRIVADASGAIERVRREMSGVYRLGIEMDSADADGKPRNITVKVSRPGATTRSFREIVAPITKALSPAERLKRALQSPLVEREIGIRLGTFVYRDESGAGRVLVSAEADAAAAGLKAAYVIWDQRGKPAAAGAPPREAVITEKDAPPLVLFVVPVPPGDHTVKLALVDADGRVGSAVRRVTLAPTLPEAFELGDVVVLPEGQDAERARPSARIAQGSRRASVYFELYGGTRAPTKATVQVEVADSPEGQALVATHAPVALKRTGRLSRAAGQLKFSPAALPPGRYFARLRVEGAEGVEEVRGFTVIAGTSTALLSDESRLLVPLFNLNRFLSAPLLGAISSRFTRDAGDDAAVLNVASALQDGSWREMDVVTGNAVVDATLRGLRALAAGQAPEAERAFRDALDADPEFTLALTLVGGAWASVGRDREASRSWRTSLATGIDAPYLHPFVADALLRTGDVKGTREFVSEVREAGADANAIERHRAIAAAIAGDRRETVAALTPWVDAHADDLDAAFVLLLALYELKTIDKDPAAAEQFAVRARQYVERGGPRQALVARWLK